MPERRYTERIVRATISNPLCIPLLIAAGIVASAGALAQSAGGDFELDESTIDAGGGTAAGPELELTGTIAQPEASPQESRGGDFHLAGGFWSSSDDTIFANGFE